MLINRSSRSFVTTVRLGLAGLATLTLIAPSPIHPAPVFATSNNASISEPAGLRFRALHSAPRISASPRHLNQASVQTSAPACNNSWQTTASLNSGTDSNEFTAVSAISPTDAWAVGDYLNGSAIDQPQTQHWDGAAWTPVTPVTVGLGDNALLSVAAIATNDVWAVGYSSADTSSPRSTLIEHWDGTSWSAVTSPNGSNPSNSLFGVKAASSTDVWAVGRSLLNSTTASTLVEHWNGTSWSVVSSPNPSATGFNEFSDVRPISSTDAWAVGGHQDAGSAMQTMVAHWDGSAWSTVASPNPSAGGNFLAAISGETADLWAVGGRAASNTADSTLVEHWNGGTWSVVSSPTPDLSANLLTVRYGAANDVWAAGASAYSGLATAAESDHSLVEHWDGTVWKQVPSPNPAQTQAFFDLAIAQPNQLWAVGFYQNANSPSQTFAATLCAPVPAVTGLNPSSGSALGGTSVSITGSGLSFARGVAFGSVAAADFSVKSDSLIVATSPAQPIGTTVDVTVTTMGGTSPTTPADQYTYVPGWGAWEGLGGLIAPNAAVTSWGSGRLDAFVLGKDGQLWHRWYDGSWHWEPLAGSPTAEPAAVAPQSGQLHVFIRGSDNALYHRSFSANAWSPSWERLGGVLAAEPSAVSLGGGSIDVFVRGTDNHLWYAAFDGTSWTWHGVGGVISAAPAAVSSAPATADAFVQGADSALWRWSSVDGWHGLGGRIVAKPSATSWGGGRLDAFVQGADNGLWHWSTASGGTWEGVGGQLAGRPASVTWGSPRLDVFVRGTDLHLWHAASNGSGWQWEGLGGVLAGPPSGSTWGQNRLDVFGVGTDNQLWHRAYD